MRRIESRISLIAAALLVVFLAGCGSDGPAGDPNQMANARDAQEKSLAGQKNAGVNRGAGSVEAAGKAGK
jgi:predicted small lipoprotein YifL